LTLLQPLADALLTDPRVRLQPLLLDGESHANLSHRSPVCAPGPR